MRLRVAACALADATKTQASHEITRLEGLQCSPRADQIHDQRAVQADLQAGAGDSVRHSRAETRGYGSDCRWSHLVHDE